ncbi:hypothetical protein SMAC4_13164 [Sordaria macrospora]|uniref:uncharacterized protein n=1 Tax=Sordaria macrospora TaxID=5147 RepID=UPI002B299A6D|nr:hypothetical protein SMAC4_13164 [Sordaria macrospora]
MIHVPSDCRILREHEIEVSVSRLSVSLFCLGTDETGRVSAHGTLATEKYRAASVRHVSRSAAAHLAVSLPVCHSSLVSDGHEGRNVSLSRHLGDDAGQAHRTIETCSTGWLQFEAFSRLAEITGVAFLLLGLPPWHGDK